MTRMATAALSIVLATVSGIAGAQAAGQLDVLQQAIRICSNPRLTPDDWDGAFAGWTRTQPTDELIARAAADQRFGLIVSDNASFAALSPVEVTEQHRLLVDDFASDLADMKANLADGDEDLRLYQHESAWLVSLRLDWTRFPEQSGCIISHQTPDADVIAFLETPHFFAAPFRMIGGRGLFAETAIADGDAPAAELDLALFLLDPAELAPGAIPDSHPAHYASKVSMVLDINSSSRGKAE